MRTIRVIAPLTLFLAENVVNGFVAPTPPAALMRRGIPTAVFEASIDESTLSQASTEALTAQDSDAFVVEQQRQRQYIEVGGISATADQVAAVTNTMVVGGIAALASWILLHEKLEALFALWVYGLGPHGPDVTLATVAWDTMSRLPTDAIHSYEMLVPTNPVFWKAVTSGVAYALGDYISQLFQGKTIKDADLPRSFRSGAAGFIVHGPLCHFWLLFMETYLDFDGAWWATGLKVTADLTVWSIFLSAAYATVIGVLAFRPMDEVWNDVKVTSWPALRSAWRFWPFVHTISFSHAVPLDLKLLWVDVMEVVWVTILSKVNNEDKALSAAVADNEELQEESEADPMEIPQKVLAACWPLLAMWPVLWAGYQVEHALGLVK